VSAKTDAPLWFGPGGSDLELYRRFGGGAALFRAYLKRREADQLKAYRRRQENLSTLQTAPALGPDYIAVLDELIMSHILEELDPLIRDLERFCDDPGPTDEQLRALRQALRIGRGRSPHDVARARQRENAIQWWHSAYRQMQNTMMLLSDRAIAHEIADRLRISPRAAWGYWQQLKKSDPLIEATAQRIREHIRRHAIPGRRRATSSHLSIVGGKSVKANRL
jgi:hypothetical protein